ncbi:helix-turn-helix domain-containing protein [Streptomycetaceae bacterium NBC_01309]
MTYTDDTAAWTEPGLTTDTIPVVDVLGRPLLLTPEEAGALVRRSGGWMRRKAAAGEIPCTVLGRTVLFSDTDLDDLIVIHHRPATST